MSLELLRLMKWEAVPDCLFNGQQEAPLFSGASNAPFNYLGAYRGEMFLQQPTAVTTGHADAALMLKEIVRLLLLLCLC